MQVQSANGNISLERVAEAGGSSMPLLMFQLYVFKDRNFTAKVIRSAHHPLIVWQKPLLTAHSCITSTPSSSAVP